MLMVLMKKLFPSPCLLLCLIFSVPSFGKPLKLVMGIDADPYYRTSPSYLQFLSFVKDALEPKHIAVEFIEMPSARITLSANAGTIDSDPLTSESEFGSLKNVVAVPFPYYKFRMVYFSRKSSPGMATPAMKGETICGPRWTQISLKKFYDEQQLRFFPLDEYQQCLKMVGNSRISFGAISTLVLEDLRSKSDPLLNDLVFSDHQIFSIDLYMIVNIKHKNLLPVLESALREHVKNKSRYPLIADRLAP